MTKKFKMPFAFNGTKSVASVFSILASSLLLASCSQEPLMPGEESAPEGPLEKDASYYLNFRVAGAGGSTRADFEDGDGRESVINNMKLVFYDASGNVVGDVHNASEGAYVEVKPSASDWKTDVSAGTVEQYFNKVVRLDLVRGQSLPAYVMCFVNPSEASVGTWTLTELETKDIDSFSSTVEGDSDRGIAAGEVFAMNNSVFYDYDPMTPSSGVDRALVRAVPIPTDALKRTESEAAAASVVKINVERRAARLKVSRAAGSSSSFADLGFSFEFVPEKWALNSYEKKSYVSKNFRTDVDPITGGIGSTNFTWDGLVTRLGNNDATSNWQWNDKTNNRSYWAFSPSYYTSNFPLVSDDVRDNSGSEVIDNSENFNNGYNSYNEILNNNGVALGSTTYQHENTLGVSAINNANNILAAIPSVVLVGKNIMKLGGTTIALSGKTPTFYRRANTSDIYFNDSELTALKNLVSSSDDKAKFKGVMQALVSGTSLLYYNDGEKYQPVSNLPYSELASIFDVEHPTKDVRQDVAVPERNVTLQLKDINTTGIWDAQNHLKTNQNKVIYVRNGQNIQPVTKDATAYLNINRELVSRAGYAETYTEGMAFYNIPIKHLGWYSALNSDKDSEDLSTFNWDNVKVGWFGLVRNHSYSMELGNITKLGTGILDPDQPIVPDKQKESYFINYQINVLQWRVVPTQRPIL